jgi:hypothetical protein
MSMQSGGRHDVLSAIINFHAFGIDKLNQRQRLRKVLSTVVFGQSVVRAIWRSDAKGDISSA